MYLEKYPVRQGSTSQLLLETIGNFFPKFLNNQITDYMFGVIPVKQEYFLFPNRLSGKSLPQIPPPPANTQIHVSGQ